MDGGLKKVVFVFQVGSELPGGPGLRELQADVSRDVIHAGPARPGAGFHLTGEMCVSPAL